MKVLALALVLAIGCRDKPKHPRFPDYFFSKWDDRRVLCGVSADRTHSYSLDELKQALDRTVAETLVLHTYGHAPTFDLDEYLPVFQYAHEHHIAFVTYSELTDRSHPRAGWAFSIDDDEVDVWFGWRDKLRAANVHFTFFVSNFDKLTADQRGKLHQLAADGHDIQPHGLNHVHAVEDVYAHGLSAYVASDVLPDLDAMRRDGFTPTTFSFPYGAHSPLIDEDVLQHVLLVRAATTRWCR